MHRSGLGALAALAFLAGVPAAAQAKCEPPDSIGQLRHWPAFQLDERSAILLGADVDVGPHADELVRQLGPEPALVSDGHRVELDVVFESHGHREAPELQLLLRPREPLRLGRRYELAVGEQRLSWDVARRGGTEALAWSGPPREIDREYVCGLESHLRIEVPVTSPALRVRLRATPTGGGEVHERIVHLERTGGAGVIDVGHLSCGGAVMLEPGAEYRIEFWALDSAGNQVAGPRPLVTTAPSHLDPRPTGYEDFPDLCGDDAAVVDWLGPLLVPLLMLSPLGVLWWRTRIDARWRVAGQDPPRCVVVSPRSRRRVVARDP